MGRKAVENKELLRSERLVIRIKGKMKDKFQEKADESGVSMSSLGSIIISEWIEREGKK